MTPYVTVNAKEWIAFKFSISRRDLPESRVAPRRHFSLLFNQTVKVVVGPAMQISLVSIRQS